VQRIRTDIRRWPAHLMLLVGLIVPLFAAVPAQAQEAAWMPPAPDGVSARAVYSIDISSGFELFSLNADERLAMGSTAKIATAITTLANIDAGTEITIDASDPVSDPFEFSNMGLQPGMIFTVEELLYGLLVPSGNDAAAALARVVGELIDPDSDDPRAAFVDEMNQTAASLGAVNTHFSTADGLEGVGEHYSTARDMALLAAELLQDPLLAEIVSTPDATLTSRGNDATELTVVNTNKLLGDDSSVIGVKTGSTTTAGGCLVIASQEGNNTIITVILGSDLVYGGDTGYLVDERWNDIDAILNQMRLDYEWIDLEQTTTIEGLETELSAWNVAFKDPASVPIPQAEGDLRYRLELAPIGPADSEVGRVLFFAGSTLIAERPVYQLAT